MLNKLVVSVVMVGLITAGGCATDRSNSGSKTINLQMFFQEFFQGFKNLLNPGTETTDQQMSVQEFVSVRFVDRWPVVGAYRYGPNSTARSAAVEILEDILEDSSQKSTWAHSVATLGLLGGEKARRVIFNFITKLQELTSFSLYEQRAMHSGVVALGTWVWTSKYRPDLGFGGPSIQPAITALEKYVKSCGNFPSHIIHSPIPIICPAVVDAGLQREIAQAALLGLALSGDQTAGTVLQDFAGAPDGNPAVKNFIPEAQAAHATIKRMGLLCYYEPYSFECQQMAGRR